MFAENEKLILLQGLPQPVIFEELKKKEAKEVFVLEGRPRLDSVHSLCRQLLRRRITPTLIADNMAGFLFYKKLVKEVWVSYYATGKDGVLCNIGALILGVLAKKHRVPIYLFPSSRAEEAVTAKENEIFYFDNKRIAPKGIKGYVPLVEWLPKKYTSKVFK